MKPLLRNVIDQVVFEWWPQNEHHNEVVQVAMCTMSRISFLPWTISCLEAQNERRIRLFIWNNNLECSRELEQIITVCRPTFPVVIVHSRRNVGGIGRFLLVRFGYIDKRTPVIFMDDDQFILSNCIAELLFQWQPSVMIGWWAWRFIPGGLYWDRQRCEEGETAHYVGTGGMICDTEVILHHDFLKSFPQRFSFIEDLWISYFAEHIMGYTLLAAPNLIRQVKDGRDQYLELREKKTAFLQWLRDVGGWRV